MARRTTGTASRARRANQKHGSIELLQKLEFIAQAQKKEGGYESHCIISRQRIIAFDGTFTIGAPIAEEFDACPHTHSLIQALSRCGESVAIVMSDQGLSVQSGKLTVTVQTAPREMMPDIEPDRIRVPLDNRIKKGFEIVGVLAKEGELRLPLATLLLEANIVSATNGHAAMQFRHGIDLPPGLVLPKKFCDMVVKHPANLTGFGWNPDTSVTFWFEDETFIKTQLQRGQWPNLDTVFCIDSNPYPLPEGFAEAIATVAGFSSTGIVYFKDGSITTDQSRATVAAFECEAVPNNRTYNGKALTAMLPNIESMDMKTYEDRLIFFGCEGNMRGIMTAMRDK